MRPQKKPGRQPKRRGLTQQQLERLGQIQARQISTRKETIEYLIKKRKINTIISMLKNAGSEVRLKIIRTITELRTPETTTILKKIAIQNLHWKLTPEVIKAIREMGTPETIPVLEEIATKSQDWLTRQQAVFELGNIGTTETTKMLMEIMKKDPAIYVHFEAIRALAKRGIVEITPKIIQATKDENSFTRTDAIKVIGIIATQKMPAETKKMLKEIATNATKDQDKNVRFMAVFALREMGMPETIGTLKFIAANDKDERVRETAAEAIKKIMIKEGKSINSK